MEVFASGLQMGESPRWHDGRFWMCDWLAGEVLSFAADGSRQVVARVDGLPFSIDWLPDGRLVATSPRGLLAGPFACALGGSDGRTLFVVANQYGATGASDGVVLTERVGVERAGRP